MNLATICTFGKEGKKRDKRDHCPKPIYIHMHIHYVLGAAAKFRSFDSLNSLGRRLFAFALPTAIPLHP